MTYLEEVMYTTEGNIYLVEFSIGESLKQFKDKLVKATKDLWNNIKKVFKKIPKNDTKMNAELQGISDNTEDLIEDIDKFNDDNINNRNKLTSKFKSCSNNFKSFCSKHKKAIKTGLLITGVAGAGYAMSYPARVNREVKKNEKYKNSDEYQSYNANVSKYNDELDNILKNSKNSKDLDDKIEKLGCLKDRLG